MVRRHQHCVDRPHGCTAFDLAVVHRGQQLRHGSLYGCAINVGSVRSAHDDGLHSVPGILPPVDATSGPKSDAHASGVGGLAREVRGVYRPKAATFVTQRAEWSASVTARAGAAKGRDVSILEVPLGFEPRMEALQASALPLGDGTDRGQNPNCAGKRRARPALGL